MCPTLFYWDFTRGDVWAKTKVLVVRAFLCCNLGSYLLFNCSVFIQIRSCICGLNGQFLKYPNWVICLKKLETNVVLERLECLSKNHIYHIYHVTFFTLICSNRMWPWKLHLVRYRFWTLCYKCHLRRCHKGSSQWFWTSREWTCFTGNSVSSW